MENNKKRQQDSLELLSFSSDEEQQQTKQKALKIKFSKEISQAQCDIYNDPFKLQAMNFDATFKLILIGDSGVGKSCIIKRIGSNTFKEEHEVTIGADFTSIGARINNKINLKLQFWDSCGQERYNSITRIFYRNSSCVILVYDVFELSSLKNLEKIWIEDLKKNLKDAILILVGNKIDSVDKYSNFKQISTQQGIAFTKKHNLNYFTEVSAKTNEGINELLAFIAKTLYFENQKTLDEYREDSDYSSDTSSPKKYQEEVEEKKERNKLQKLKRMEDAETPNSSNSTQGGNGARNNTNTLTMTKIGSCQC